MYFKTILLI